MARRKDQRERITVPTAWFENEIKFGAQLLGLTHWDITVQTKPVIKVNGDHAEGLCEPHDGHLTCRFTFKTEILRGEARYNVYHELGHLLFRSWNRADQKVMDDMVPNALTDRVNEVLTKGEEDAVERFAHAIVRLLPVDRREPDGVDP